MAKIVENGVTTEVPGKISDVHRQNIVSGWIPVHIMRADCNRYVMVTYLTREGERTLYIWP